MNLVPNLFVLCTYLLLNFWYFLEFSGRLKSLYSSYFTLGNDRITRKTAIFNILKLWLGNILVWQFLSELFGLAMSCPSDFPLLGTLGDQKTHDTALDSPLVYRWEPCEPPPRPVGARDRPSVSPTPPEPAQPGLAAPEGAWRTTQTWNQLLLSPPSLQ